MRTLNLLAASAVALVLAAGATAAQADPVQEAEWAGVNNDGGLGGSFAYQNSSGDNPITSSDSWSLGYTYSDVVFRASFGAVAQDNFSNYDGWQAPNSNCCFGSNATTTFGETFFAPGTYVESFDFLIRNYGNEGGCVGSCMGDAGAFALGPVDATFAIALWNGTDTVGGALFTRHITVPLSGGFEWTNVGEIDLQLQQGQQYIAFLTVADLSVPEPATWAMMLMGFGGLGAVLRRRKALALA